MALASPNTCLLCNDSLSGAHLEATDLLTTVPGTFVYRQCAGCGSYQQTPLPSQEFLTACYAGESLGYHTPPEDRAGLRRIGTALLKGVGSVANVPLRAIDQLFSWTCDCLTGHERLEKALPSIPPPARVLDIGCSWGRHLVSLRKKGYDVAGIELAAEPARIARERHGLDVRSCPIEECDFPDSRFDVILMSHVMEHLLNPRAVAEKIRAWLAPGGEFLFKCPCAEGPEFRRFGAACFVLQPPYHVFIPTREGMRRLLSPAFGSIEMVCQAGHADWIESAQLARKAGLPGHGAFFAAAAHPAGKPLKTLIRLAMRAHVHMGGTSSRMAARCRI